MSPVDKHSTDLGRVPHPCFLWATGLGSTVPELDTAPLGNLLLGTYDKTKFSMAIPPVTALLKKHDFKSIVLFGIEVSVSSAS